MNYEIVPPDLAVKSMRDNGYKNAAYALAELMDNSIQADATHIELLIGEKFTYDDRQVSRLDTIAVLDNGMGMAPDVLQIALQFGNGTHIDRRKQNGIGKFGMGLPAASISQCRKVEVYSWQDGLDSSFYTYIDIDEIVSKDMQGIPRPERKQVPTSWRKIGKRFGDSGTLVIWSKIDRCHWKRGNTIIRHSEALIGRIYRRQIATDHVAIRMYNYDVEGDQKLNEIFAKPNDPLYLMSNTSCPEPWDHEPMFEQWGDTSTKKVEFRDEVHEVRIRYSIAKRAARDGKRNAGSEPHGKHAAQNVGLSIMRADREITLDPKWAIPFDTRERWWGVEIEFEPALDEIFGLTNNKQSVAIFEDLATENIKELQKDGSSYSAYKRELEDNKDPAAYLLDIVTEINNNLGEMRKKISAQANSNVQAEKRSGLRNAEKAASDSTKERQNSGHQGTSDEDESLPEEVRKKQLQQTLIDNGYAEDDARKIAESLVDQKSKYRFEAKSLEGPSFFSIRPQAGILIIYLNDEHPAYRHLIELLTDDIDDNESVASLRHRLAKARDGLFLLFAAWARFEDEQIDDRTRERLQDIRTDWGKVARAFLRSDD